MKIAYFGIPGSFTHTAASKIFDTEILVGAPTFDDVFNLLVQKEADRAVIPIENTLAGSIYDNYDLLEKHNLHIVGETYLRVEHSLLGVTNDVSTIKKVVSHPKALEQCSIFFEKHADILKESYTDTASAAKFVSEENDETIAAIASTAAGTIYNLTVIQKNLENNRSNFTRFLVIARDQLNDTNTINKCSVMVTLPHIPGSLSSVLNLLVKHSCNLTKIESRPIHDRPFEYVFYLDFLFDFSQDKLEQLLQELEQSVAALRILGLYQDART